MIVVLVLDESTINARIQVRWISNAIKKIEYGL
jgi:hypothetical protein